VTRKRALILLGIVTAALAIFLAVIDPSLVEDGNPSIVDFEFAWDEQGAAEIVSDWGDDGVDHARVSLWVDYIYLLAYGAFLVLAAVATRDLAAERGWRRMAAFGVAAPAMAAAGAAFDAIEDVGLLLALDGHGGDLAPGLAAVCASLKFLLTTTVIVYLLIGLVLRLRSRGAGSAPGGASTQ
jgi:hypothetical protein